jgi:hypothetical protein
MSPVASTERPSQVTLIRISMAVPNKHGVHAPVRNGSRLTISYTEFVARYADHGQVCLVSFAKDGLSNAVPVTAYGNLIVAGEQDKG